MTLMTIHLAPGPFFLARLFFRAAPPSVAIYILVNELAKRLGRRPSRAFVILVSLLAKPVFSSIAGRLATLIHMRRHGAVPIPRVKNPKPYLPAGLGFTAEMVKSFQSGYPGDIFLKWRQHYGNTYAIKVGGELRVMTIEPEYIKAILATQFDAFDKGPVLWEQFASLLGSGVFNADGDMWKFHRGITRPFFSRDRISDFDIFERHTEAALALAAERLAQGYHIDFQDLVSRFTLDSASEFLFGQDVASLSATLPYPPDSSMATSEGPLHPSDKFVTAFAAGQSLTSLRTRYGPAWPLSEFWADRIRTSRDVVDEFVGPIMEEALKRQQIRADTEGRQEGGDEMTLLDHLVVQTQDRQVLKDELVNLLVAGRDTTAALLTFSVYMLSQSPHVAGRLREEIARVVGMHARPTVEQIKDMKYLRAFINETLRLYPPVPFDNRTSNRATVWPSTISGKQPFYVPAHTRCVFSFFLMHRRTDLWGPDEFDPDRFLDDRLHTYLTPNPFIFLPFLAGPRICLGQQFAYNEASFFLVRLLQRFETFTLEQPREARPPAEWSQGPTVEGSGRAREKVMLALHLTMYVKGGLWVKMGSAAPVVKDG